MVGANSAGVSAAVAAARRGVKTILIEETDRIGGMAANGLGASDIRRAEHASGFFDEFRRKVAAIYGSGNGLRYEPRVAQQAIEGLVSAEPNIMVYRGVRPTGVKTSSGRILEVRAEVVATGRRIRIVPALVVDATECADVAFWAGVPMRIGREARSAREPHAGVIYYDRKSDSRLPGSTGRGDKRLQAYSYLMTVKDFGPGANKTIPKPPGYDPTLYDQAPKWSQSWAVTSGKLPNNKYEINQHPEGSDLQGVNYKYPTASYSERRVIEDKFWNHALGYLYYIQTVEGMAHIGLTQDDYPESGGRPSLLYIREARRLKTAHMMDEADIRFARDIARSDAIGIGDYAMDSHATQPKHDSASGDMGEGEFYLPQYTPWHQVPYRIMVPDKVTNLFAPTAVAATHVAYGTYRMEPVRMHLGTAAGVAASICLRFGLKPSEVPVRQIQEEISRVRTRLDGSLEQSPSYLYLFSDVNQDTPKFAPIQWLAARGFYPCPVPAERTPAAMLRSALFLPNEPVTHGEAQRLMSLLVARRQASEVTGSNGTVRIEPASLTSSATRVLTRSEIVLHLAGFVGAKVSNDASHYLDVKPDSPVGRAAEALYAMGIDSRLWDGFDAARNPAGLLLRPDDSITRAQFAQLVYLAHQSFGPGWDDFEADKSPIPLAPPAR